MAFKLLYLWLGLVLLLPAMAQSQQQVEVSIAAEHQQLQKQLLQTSDKTKRFTLLVKLAEILVLQGQVDKALPKALEALQIAIDLSDSVQLQMIRYQLAQIYLDLYAYPQAIQVASDGLSLAMAEDDNLRQAEFLQAMAQASQLDLQFQAAEEYARKALDLRLASREQAVIASLHLSLARSLLPQHKYQESEQQLQLALLAAQQAGNKVEQANAQQLLAWLDLYFERPAMAHSRYQQIHQLLQDDVHQANFRLLSLAFIKALLEFGHKSEAVALYQQLAIQATHFALPQDLLLYWTLSAQIAELKQDYKQAYVAAEQARQLLQTSFDDRIQKQLQVVTSEQHKELLERDLQKAAQQGQLEQLAYQHQKNMLLLLSVGACLALALLLSLFYHKSRRNRLLLQKQQEMAQQKIAVKNEFIATLGHEIRTPLQGIDAVLAQLLPEITQQESQQKILLARRSVWSLGNIINNILTSSRLDYGVYQPLDQLVVLTELLDQLHNLLGPLASNKGLKLSYSVASNLPDLLLLDENLVTQILTNLISNAVKYTKQGEIEVRVELIEQQGSMLNVLFKVRDTGIGLTTLEVSQLLRGERLNRQRSLQAGPGLGMLVCQKLLQQLGSALQIQSVPGLGTEVSFQLKCQASDLLPTVLAGAHEQNQALVIEDDELCRMSLEQMLTQLGFAVITASSLQQIKQLPPQRWAWVFVDGQLEDADAVQSILQLEMQHQVDQNTRFILVSGSPPQQIAPQISALLMKPWRREQLQALIAQLAQLPALNPLYQLDYLQQTLQTFNTEQRQALKLKVREQLDALQQELNQTNPDVKVFHRMIGSMGQLGLLRLSQLCQLTEKQLLQQERHDPLLLHQLQLCLHQTQQAIEQLFTATD